MNSHKQSHAFLHNSTGHIATIVDKMGVSKSTESLNNDKKKKTKKKEKKAKKENKSKKEKKLKKEKQKKHRREANEEDIPSDSEEQHESKATVSSKNGDAVSTDDKYNNQHSLKKSKSLIAKPSTSTSTSTTISSKPPLILDQSELSSKDSELAVEAATRTSAGKTKKKIKKRDRDVLSHSRKYEAKQQNGNKINSSPSPPSKRQKKKADSIPSSQPVVRSTTTNATQKNKGCTSSTSAATVTTANAPPRHPFPVDDTDHCETPLKAYQDIQEILDRICKGMNKTRENLIIYDPYYCDGGVRIKLQSLGYLCVINHNRDFYNDIKNNKLPKYDVIVTNPPYSGTHIEKLLTYCFQKQNQPFLLLLPHFVYTKDYYQRSLKLPTTTTTSTISNTNENLFFMIPESRYSYLPPMWVNRSTGSTALGKGKDTTAPFPSFWYCSDGYRQPSINNNNNICKNNDGNYNDGNTNNTKRLVSKEWLSQTFGKSGIIQRGRKFTSKLRYACCTRDIPRDFKGEFDVSKKRPNPKARKRAAMRKKREKMM